MAKRKFSSIRGEYMSSEGERKFKKLKFSRLIAKSRFHEALAQSFPEPGQPESAPSEFRHIRGVKHGSRDIPEFLTRSNKKQRKERRRSHQILQRLQESQLSSPAIRNTPSKHTFPDSIVPSSTHDAPVDKKTAQMYRSSCPDAALWRAVTTTKLLTPPAKRWIEDVRLLRTSQRSNNRSMVDAACQSDFTARLDATPASVAQFHQAQQDNAFALGTEEALYRVTAIEIFALEDEMASSTYHGVPYSTQRRPSNASRLLPERPGPNISYKNKTSILRDTSKHEVLTKLRERHREMCQLESRATWESFAKFIGDDDNSDNETSQSESATSAGSAEATVAVDNEVRPATQADDRRTDELSEASHPALDIASISTTAAVSNVSADGGATDDPLQAMNTPTRLRSDESDVQTRCGLKFGADNAGISSENSLLTRLGAASDTTVVPRPALVLSRQSNGLHTPDTSEHSDDELEGEDLCSNRGWNTNNAKPPSPPPMVPAHTDKDILSTAHFLHSRLRPKCGNQHEELVAEQAPATCIAFCDEDAIDETIEQVTKDVFGMTRPLFDDGQSTTLEPHEESATHNVSPHQKLESNDTCQRAPKSDSASSTDSTIIQSLTMRLEEVESRDVEPVEIVLGDDSAGQETNAPQPWIEEMREVAEDCSSKNTASSKELTDPNHASSLPSEGDSIPLIDHYTSDGKRNKTGKREQLSVTESVLKDDRASPIDSTTLDIVITHRTPVNKDSAPATPQKQPKDAAGPSPCKTKRKTTGTKSVHFLPLHLLDRVDLPSPTGKRAPIGVSIAPVPPIDAQHFGIIQEKLWDDPFWLLIAVTLLNKTAGRAAVPVFWQIKNQYCTPSGLASADPEELKNMIQSLGLQNQRTKRMLQMAAVWVSDPPVGGTRYKTPNYPNRSDHVPYNRKGAIISSDEQLCKGALEIGHLPGCGAYAWDSWRIFCRDTLRGEAEDYNGKGAKDPENFEPEWKRVLPLDKELRATLRWMWLREGWIWDCRNGEKRRATEEEMERARKGEMEVPDEEEGKFAARAVEVLKQGGARDRGKEKKKKKTEDEIEGEVIVMEDGEA